MLTQSSGLENHARKAIHSGNVFGLSQLTRAKSSTQTNAVFGEVSLLEVYANFVGKNQLGCLKIFEVVSPLNCSGLAEIGVAESGENFLFGSANFNIGAFEVELLKLIGGAFVNLAAGENKG